MSTLFISHRSTDNAYALALHAWLIESGWPAPFLDISLDNGLSPGQRWQDELTAAADRCEAVLALISPAWCQAPWCIAELSWAHKLHKTVFGVLIKPTPPELIPSILVNEWQLCDLVEGDERRVIRVGADTPATAIDVSLPLVGLRRLRDGLTKSGLDPQHFVWPPASDPLRCPYPGLRALDVDDAPVFFGRDADIVRGIGALRDVRERGVEKLFVVVGASGSGKSSLLRAGFWPRLDRDDHNFLPIPVLRPNGGAVTGLILSLEKALRRLNRPVTRAALREAVATPEALRTLLAKLQAARQWPDGGTAPTIILVVDQAEELFSTEDRQESDQFLALLSGLWSTTPDPAPRQVIVLFGIRSDAYERLQTEPLLQSVRSFLFDLRTVPSGAYQSVIEGPALRSTAAGRKLVVDPALTSALLADTQGADALPLLAFTLEQLFLEHGADGDLTLAEYKSFGGFSGAITAAIEEAFKEPDHPPAVPADRVRREALLRRGFVPFLAGIDPGSGAARRRVAFWADIPEDARPALERLVAKRLLVLDHRELDGRRGRVTVVEVAHEALLRQWPALASWLQDDAQALKVLDAVRQAAADWRANSDDPLWLVHIGSRLGAAEALAGRPGFETLLGADGHAYVDACVALDQAERRDRAIEFARLMNRAVEVGNRQQHYDRAMRFGLLALAECDDDAVRTTATLGLLHASQNCQLEATINARSGATGALAWSPDNAFIACATADGGVAVWSRTGGDCVAHFGGHAGPVSQALWHPSGRYVLSCSTAGDAFVWDSESGQLLADLTSSAGSVLAMALSGDGRCVVTASHDGLGRIWNAADGRLLATLSGHEGPVLCASFAFDGTAVFTGSADGTVRCWSMATAALQGAPLPHASAVRSLACSPDGRRLLTVAADGAATLWDAHKRRAIASLGEAHPSIVVSAFSADSQRLMTAATDGARAHLWDAGTGRRRARFDAPVAPISSAVFCADALSALIGHADGSATMASVVTGRTALRLIGQDGPLTIVACSPDGLRAATAGVDGSLRIWSLRNRFFRGVLAKQRIHASPAVFSADGRYLVTCDDAGFANVWHLESGRKFFTAGAPVDLVQSAAFTPEGLLVTTAYGQRIDFWQLPAASDNEGPAEAGDVADLPAVAVRVECGPDRPLGEPALQHARESAEGQPPSEIAQFEAHPMAISADGKLMVVASHDGTIALWEASPPKRVASFSGHEGAVFSATFSPDEAGLVSASWDGTARLWRIRPPKLLAVLKGHDGPVVAAVFGHDGSRVFTASSDHTVRAWDAATGLPLVTFRLADATALAVAVSPDGHWLAATTADGVYRWSISVLSHLRGAELATHVANTQLQGAGQVTATDVIAAPLLRGREGEDVFRGLSDVA